MNANLFDIQKIKELTSSIEDLQVKINRLNNLKKRVFETKKNFTQFIDNEEITNHYEVLFDIVKNLYNQLSKVSKENLDLYLFYRDTLISKYKEDYKERLKKVKIDNKITKNIGVNLIENKKVCKIIDKISFIASIELSQWLEIIDSLKKSSIFSNTVKNLSNFYKILIQNRLNNKLSEIPQDTDFKLIEDYKKAFLKHPDLTFFEFIKKKKQNLSKGDLDIKKEIIQKAKEKEEIEKLKKKQQEQQEAYQKYLSLSDSEFKRLRRKKKREKLNNFNIKPEAVNQIEISEEISKKIEKFKSQFEKSFNKKHLIEKDDSKDPLELIRERKIKKEKEYKKYEDHFENN